MQFGSWPGCLYQIVVLSIPVDVMLIPMVLAVHLALALYIRGDGVFGFGGLFGYAIGMFAFEQIAEPALIALGKADAMAEYAIRFNDMGFWTCDGGHHPVSVQGDHNHVGCNGDAPVVICIHGNHCTLCSLLFGVWAALLFRPAYQIVH